MVGVKDPSGPVRVKDQAWLCSYLSLGRTGGMGAPEGDLAVLLAGQC